MSDGESEFEVGQSFLSHPFNVLVISVPEAITQARLEKTKGRKKGGLSWVRTRDRSSTAAHGSTILKEISSQSKKMPGFLPLHIAHYTACASGKGGALTMIREDPSICPPMF